MTDFPLISYLHNTNRSHSSILGRLRSLGQQLLLLNTCSKQEHNCNPSCLIMYNTLLPKNLQCLLVLKRNNL